MNSLVVQDGIPASHTFNSVIQPVRHRRALFAMVVLLGLAGADARPALATLPPSTTVVTSLQGDGTYLQLYNKWFTG